MSVGAYENFEVDIFYRIMEYIPPFANAMRIIDHPFTTKSDYLTCVQSTM